MNYAHIAAEVFNRPHMIEPGYARVFVSALARQGVDIRSLTDVDGTVMDAADMRGVAEDYERRDRKLFEQAQGIAIIPVEGTLAHRFGSLDPMSGMTGYDGVQAKLEAALNDPDVEGILLDINSPGGSVSGCFDLADQIYEGRQIKPIWALADELAASAAYALASSASHIVTPRTGQLGSVGVITMHVDQSQMLAGEGLDVTLVYAGDHKADGNSFEPLPDDVRADIQADIDYVYGLFVDMVARNRSMRANAVRDTQARVFNANNAVQNGMVDEIMPAHHVLDAFNNSLRGARRSSSNSQGAKKMALPLFGRSKPNATAPSDGAVDHIAALTAGGFEVEASDEHQVLSLAISDDAESLDIGAFMAAHAAGAINDEQAAAALPAIAEQAAGQKLYTEATAREAFAPADNRASLDALVSLCGEHNCSDLAAKLRDRGVSAEQAEAIMADVDSIRDKMAATFPGDTETANQMATKFAIAAHGSEAPQIADALGALMVEATAVMSGEEVDHHKPDTAQAAGKGAINAHAVHKRLNSRK